MSTEPELARSALIRSLELCELGLHEAAVLEAFCAIGLLASRLGDRAKGRVASWLATELVKGTR